MRVLSISTDRKIFEDGSAVASRVLEYAKKVEEMHVVVFTGRGFKQKVVGNVHIYPTNSFNRVLYVFDAYRLGKKIAYNAKLSKLDSVISTQDPFETGLVGYLLHKKFNMPLQLQVHTDFLSPHFNTGFLNRIRRIIAQCIVPKAQGIRTVSQVIKDSIQTHFQRLTVIPDVLPVFVDINHILGFEPIKNLSKEFPQFKFIIFMASRLTREKRIDVALSALKKIVGEFPHTGLVIAGSGHELSSLKNKAKRLGISKNVAFVGWQKDLISYFKTADMFLLSSEYEGYGMTLIEAGASGCPIVTTEVGIAKTHMFKHDENCLICPVNNTDCLGESISRLIHNNAKRELFKLNMLDTIKKVSVSQDEYSSKYVELLHNLLSTNKDVDLVRRG